MFLVLLVNITWQPTCF